jgi:NAD(P)H-nitrite reductase large subunit
VVVLGNGIAGVTAADLVRRNHPDCEVHVVGQESHHLYNRMGISRLVFGRSAMQGLHLLPDQWYDDHRITTWLNTRAVALDTLAQTVRLGTGDELRYDRLILATGSRTFLPDWPGFGLPGTFVLREADDAMAIRRFAQEHGAAQAVVVGGGLLGVEAAHALHLLGLHAVILEVFDHLLGRQADERSAQLIADYLENLGIDVLTGVALDGMVDAGGRVTGVALKDGRVVPADVVVAATGIRPNAELARDAGIAVGRGVLVDDRMRTSAPNVFAAGDVAEYDGQVLGLWPVAVNQAEVAARNALGADDACPPLRPLALLKGVGIDFLSIGRFTPEPGDEVLVVDEGRGYQYAKVVVRDGRVVGGILVDRPADHAALIDAVHRQADAVPPALLATENRA